MSTGQRFVLPFQTVVSSLGLPLNGAQLFFYLTGTSTPANTYSDQALSTPNSNPVVANSGGQPTGQFGNIWLDPTITYKVVLEDASNNVIWTADPVPTFGGGSSGGGGGAGITTYANIAALRAATPGTPTAVVYVQAYASTVPVGAGWFVYVASDTTSTDNGGTIIVDAQNHRYYRLVEGSGVSIEDFGAVRDSGTTDNATAINNALAACSDVTVPAATDGSFYGFASLISIPSKTRLRGFGKGSVLQATVAFGVGGPLIQNKVPSPANAGARDDGVRIEDLTIDGNSQGTANLAFTAVQNGRIRNLTCLRPGGEGILIQPKATDPTIFPQNLWIDGCYVLNATNNGVKITGGSELDLVNLIIDGAVKSGVNATAVSSVATGRNIKLVNPIIRNCGGLVTDAGLLFNGNGSSAWAELSVVGGSIDAQTGVGVSYVDVTGLNLNGVNINTCSGAGVARAAGGSVAATGLVFHGVAVKSATSDGFYLNNESYPTVSACAALSCGRDGIRLDGTTTHAAVTGCSFKSNGGIGFNEVSSTDYSMFSGVNSGSNTGGDAVILGAHTRVRACNTLSVQFEAEGYLNGTTPSVVAGSGITNIATAGNAWTYLITMSPPMPNANYRITGLVAGSGADAICEDSTFTRTTTQFQVRTFAVGQLAAMPFFGLSVKAIPG